MQARRFAEELESSRACPNSGGARGVAPLASKVISLYVAAHAVEFEAGDVRPKYVHATLLVSSVISVAYLVRLLVQRRHVGGAHVSVVVR